MILTIYLYYCVFVSILDIILINSDIFLIELDKFKQNTNFKIYNKVEKKIPKLLIIRNFIPFVNILSILTIFIMLNKKMKKDYSRRIIYEVEKIVLKNKK